MSAEVLEKSGTVQGDILPAGTFFAEAPRPHTYSVETLQKSEIEAYRRIMLHNINTMPYLTDEEKKRSNR